MIRSVLKRRGFFSSSLARLLDESGARSLRTEATGVTSTAPAWTGENVLTRMGFLRSFSGVSHKQKNPSSSSSSDSSESDLEDVLPPPPSPHTDTAMLLRSLNAYQFQQHLKELRGSERHITYSEFLKLAKAKGATATLAESRQLCDAMLASGTMFRYGNRVYLDPAEIADSVRSVLPGTLEETEALIKELETEIEPLEKKKRELEDKTHATGTRLLWSGVFGALGVTFGLWWMTYSTLSWDLVEPMAYFMTLGIGIACYLYYVIFREDLHFSSVTTRVKEHYRKKFNITDFEKYEALNKKLAANRAFLTRIKR